MDAVLAALSNPAVVSVAAMLLEAMFRMLPTQKPLSIMHVIAGVAHTVGNVAGALANFLDKVLPQNLAPPASK